MTTPSGKITLKDIAAQCDCSINTVSRALRDDPRLPASTIARIKDTASALGYVHNSAASALRSGRTNLVAVIVEDIQNPYYANILSDISVSLRESGYRTLILCSHQLDDYVDSALPLVLSYNVSGIILFPRTDSLHAIQVIQQNRIPLVLVPRSIPGCEVDAALCDDYRGGYLAGERLAREGHTRFLCLAGPESNTSQALRYSGFLAALADCDISDPHIRILSNHETLDAIYYGTLADLLLPVDYSAIVSVNDSRLYSALEVLEQHGYAIPRDISAIGYDHLRGFMSFMRPLTSIASRPEDRIGVVAAELLIDRIHHPKRSVRTRILPVILYDEGTTAPPFSLSPHYG